MLGVGHYCRNLWSSRGAMSLSSSLSSLSSVSARWFPATSTTTATTAATTTTAAMVVSRRTSVRTISFDALTVQRCDNNDNNNDDSSLWTQTLDKTQLVFGTTFSRHMLQVEWHHTPTTTSAPNNNLEIKGEWGPPRIMPCQNLSLSPAASSLHYGLQCFEGMKAYRSLSDPSTALLFRPDKNLERLERSMRRLQMPGADFDHSQLLQCLSRLVDVDRHWIPEGEGYALYLRPTVIATHPYLGLAPPTSLLLYMITSPVGPYYQTGFRPIRLWAESRYVRAWPGGTGNAKVGGNYAPTMKPQLEAAQTAGCAQVLWLFGPDEEITEVGSMNVFVVLQQTDGTAELVTAPLDRGDILPGVTRDSILHLARTEFKDQLVVSERTLTMAELRQAASDGRLLEMFGAGTAAVVTPIDGIEYQPRDNNNNNNRGIVSIPVPATGAWTQTFWTALTGIQYGTRPGPDGWSVPVPRYDDQ